jgi:hypothetical protein
MPRPAHLAHPRLPALQDSHQAARRLVLAEGLLEAGGYPRGGSRGLSVLGDLTAEAAEQLGSFALRHLSASLSEGAAAAAALGLLFVPSPNNLSLEGEVAGLSGVSYAWNCDAT